MNWLTSCVETLHGTVHRFPNGQDHPCQCGAVVQNRRQHERHDVSPRRRGRATPYGSMTAPVVALIEARGSLSVADIAEALKRPRWWVLRYALRVAVRAGQVVKVGTRREANQEGHRRVERTVDIYGLPNRGPYPESTPHV